MTGRLISIEAEPQRLAFGVQITFAILTTAAVSCRLLARKLKDVEFQWDDYLIVVALVLCNGLIACDMIGTLYCGVGLHAADVVTKYGPDRLTIFLKVLIPVQILWATALTATKLSILLFYCRVFAVPSVHRAAKVLVVVIFLWCATVILSAFLLCRPFAYNWDPTISGGHCGNRVLSYILTGVVNIITDMAVLCLPMPVIWSLQMRLASKIGLIAVFATGFFVCVVSMVRLHSLLTVDYGDATHSVTSALIWSMLEPSLGIILACVPVLKNLIPRIFSSISGSGRSDKNATPQRNGTFEALEDHPLHPVGHNNDIYTAEEATRREYGKSVASSRGAILRDRSLDKSRKVRT